MVRGRNAMLDSMGRDLAGEDQSSEGGKLLQHWGEWVIRCSNGGDMRRSHRGSRKLCTHLAGICWNNLQEDDDTKESQHQVMGMKHKYAKWVYCACDH